MNTDYSKPPLAPKPKLLCHASLRLSSPLMSRAASAARGPKPPVAPKPKVSNDPNGGDALIPSVPEGCNNGGSLASDEEAVQENEPESSPSRAVREESLVKQKFGFYFLGSGRKKSPHYLLEEAGREVGEEEENGMQETEEERRFTDSPPAEGADSLKTHQAGDAGPDAHPTDAVDLTDVDMAEDMDGEGCDAGEALADTDGLSVGDFSVASNEEGEAACRSGGKVPWLENADVKGLEFRLQCKGNGTADCTIDTLTESLIEEPVDLLVNKNTEAIVSQQMVLREGEEAEELSALNHGVSCNTSKLEYGHEIKERAENLQSFSVINKEHTTVYDAVPEHQEQLLDKDAGCVVLQPYHVSSEDIDRCPRPVDDNANGLWKNLLTTQTYLNNNTVLPGECEAMYGEDTLCRQPEDNGRTKFVSSDVYLDMDSDDRNITRPCKRWTSFKREEQESQTMEALVDHTECQPRFRLMSITVPTDTDTSTMSSVSEKQLLSTTDSDVFKNEEDLEGHIVPFLDDTTDTEQDSSDEHIYEEAGHDLDPFDKKATVMQSCSLMGKAPTYLAGTGSQTSVLMHCKGGVDGKRPPLSSSPMLNTAKIYSRPRLSLYPRSFSVEGPDGSLYARRGREGSPGDRREDSLSLPYIFTSSSSLSQRSPLPSSGLSTPTSVVDIPPPFELAYITKKPITKSSPSLLTEGDSPDKNKKKKSSIKRFLLLKFRRKSENKLVPDGNPPSTRSSSESSHHNTSRQLDLDEHIIGSSPQLNSRSATMSQISNQSPSTFLYDQDGKRIRTSVAFLNRSVVRVESFEDRSRVPFVPLPLTKPRSISFPTVDASDYENIPAISSDYENIQVPRQRPVRQGTFPEFFDRPSRMLSSANDTDGYVDMSSFTGFESRTQSSEQEAESAYTEAYKVCLVAAPPLCGTVGEEEGDAAGEDDQGHTSEEEEGWGESIYDRQPDGRSRAFYIARELVDTERLHVRALKLLQEDFREAVGAAVGDEGDPVLDEDRLREILNELPDVYTLHRRILTELENRIRNWEEGQSIADVLLSRKAEFLVFTTYIGHYDRSMSLLEDSCRTSPAFAAIVQLFEHQSPAGQNISLQHQLLQVIVRVAQYRMLLTDYLNNLSPDSQEYEDTQAAVVMVSDIADQASDSLKNGENLLRLVNIEYSVRGQRDLLQPGRVFVKEGTLMKVSRKSRQPRHLFLMNDVLLYTYPQQDGKYRLKNSLSLTGMKVSKPVVDNVQNALKIEATDISITLSASSFSEREDWFYSLTRAVSDHARGSAAFSSYPAEARERLWLPLGEKAPTLVPVSQVVMCMNCTSDFSLTLRRHHCNACGRIVCRSCSRNRYPLKYMKDRMAKVCDHCYSELQKRGGDVSTLSGNNSPRPNRSSRPLSAMFQNIHPPSLWRHRKGTAFLNQMSVSEEGSISGSLHRSKRSKRNWKRLWFLLKDKEKVASETLPLLGFTVKLPDRPQGEEESTVFQLYHKKTLYYTFKAEDNHTAQRWVNAMEEATVL
ncbi:FYVE, RhoGEF and PH domain-containing protein 5-like isoform X2 [Lampris incognitus]|uniref:FYVE, RhoGEF and PH domain-containing protein 5-like isoform X2 n=1 Tax=Lampris incognitus TaxID=2546036 RepID=UPI0024B5ECF4|nr:FYVE, RhoGEF and PH domain-containing protein 5-like isoform X2 [Lampris incognitus]